METKQILEIILILIIVLNIADAVLTSIGVTYFSEHVEEGNPITKKLLERYEMFLIVKGFFIPLCLGTLAWYISKGHTCRKEWENKLAIGSGIATIIFYIGIVINNIVIIF